MRRTLLLRLVATIWLVYLVHFNPLAPGSDRFVCVTRALVERGTSTIDDFRQHTVELSTHGGHLYINTNPGVSFLAAPAWAAVYALYQRLPPSSWLRNESVQFQLAHFVAFATTTAVLAALSAALLALFVHARSGSLWRALIAAFLYAFGTIAFFFATRLQQNVVIAFLSILLYLLVFEPEVIHVRRRSLQLVGIGLAAGVGLFVDLSILPLLVALAVPILRRAQSLGGMALVAVGLAGPVGALMLYQYSAFGNPLVPAQAYILNAGQSVHAHGMLGASLPHIGRVLSYLVTPKAGLFLFMPFTLLAVWYLPRYWKEALALPTPEKAVIAASLALYLAYVGSVESSRFTDYGPRYLMPVIPLLCLPFAFYVNRREMPLAALLVGLGFWINLAGAERGIATENVGFVLALFAFSGPWLPILDWIKKDLTPLTGYTPEVLAPHGLLLLLAIALVALWLPELLRARGNRGSFVDACVLEPIRSPSGCRRRRPPAAVQPRTEGAAAPFLRGAGRRRPLPPAARRRPGFANVTAGAGSVALSLPRDRDRRFLPRDERLRLARPEASPVGV